jgi:predicted nucleic acid-binding protein
VRESELGESQYHAVVRRFLQEWSSYVRVNLDETVLSRSKTLLEQYPLRTLDAIHLASALELQDHLEEPSVLISADIQLLKAAAAERLDTKRVQL